MRLSGVIRKNTLSFPRQKSCKDHRRLETAGAILPLSEEKMKPSKAERERGREGPNDISDLKNLTLPVSQYQVINYPLSIFS